MKVEIELPEIEGFEYTGEFRAPNKGEFYLRVNYRDNACCNFIQECDDDDDYKNYACCNFIQECDDDFYLAGSSRHILRKVKQYRELAPLEAMNAIVYNGGPVECEVSDGGNIWALGVITAIDLLDYTYPFTIKNGESYKKCRIEV
jgi:hypothetical protein